MILRSRVCGRYPKLLGPGLQRIYFHFKEPLPLDSRYRSTWRGGGFRDIYKDFFKIGKSYRVPGFLATSFEVGTAKGFIHRANKEYPRILWCILVRLLDLMYYSLGAYVLQN